MTTSEPLDLAAIEARLAAATEGPWVAEYSKEQGNCVIPHDAQSTREAVCVTRLYHQMADAEFIAHARTDIAELVSRVRELEDENTVLREEHRLADLDAKVNADTANRAEATIERVRALTRNDAFLEPGARASLLMTQIRFALDPQEEK